MFFAKVTLKSQDSMTGVTGGLRKRHTGRSKRNSMPIISSARTLPKNAGPRTGLPVDPYLKASGASALISTPKATTRKNGNYFLINSVTGRSSSIANLPSMSLSNTSFTRRSARMISKGQSDAQPPRRSQSPKAMPVRPFWPT